VTPRYELTAIEAEAVAAFTPARTFANRSLISPRRRATTRPARPRIVRAPRQFSATFVKGRNRPLDLWTVLWTELLNCGKLLLYIIWMAETEGFEPSIELYNPITV
jgi:hypothetical protein